jgi:serine/threonine protein kinase
MLSDIQECRFVLVMEEIPGIALAKLFANEFKMNDKFVVREIIVPLAQIIEGLHKREVVHGKINLNTLYYHEQDTVKIRLAESFSEPCGYGQNVYFETPDRCLANPIGRGDEEASTDYFALGVVIVQSLLGFNPVQKFTVEEYLEKCFSLGIHATLVGNRDFTGMIDDLLKGVFADNPNDRWGPAQLSLWMGGKKFNLLRPSAPREAPRPYLFRDTPHFNRKHLTYNLARDWSGIKAEFRERRVMRWIELSTKNSDLTDRLNAVLQNTGGDIGRLATDDDDMISKSFLLLHPRGPFRLQKFSSFITGFGATLAEAMRDNNTVHINYLMRILEHQYIENWVEPQKELSGFRTQELVWFIDSRRRAFESKKLGFGLERALYDLNPTLPCLSPLVIKHHVLQPIELLFSLDKASADRYRLSEPFDRHIAAFLASRLNLLNDLRTAADRFPKYGNNATLRALALCAYVQRKANTPALPGLTRWYSERLKPVVELVHSRSLRNELREEIDRQVTKGNLGTLLGLLTNVDVINQDNEGFQRAMIRYVRNAARIEELNKKGSTNKRAEDLGLRIAMVLAYGSFIATVLHLVQTYVKF